MVGISIIISSLKGLKLLVNTSILTFFISLVIIHQMEGINFANLNGQKWMMSVTFKLFSFSCQILSISSVVFTCFLVHKKTISLMTISCVLEEYLKPLESHILFTNYVHTLALKLCTHLLVFDFKNQELYLEPIKLLIKDNSNCALNRVIISLTMK